MKSKELLAVIVLSLLFMAIPQYVLMTKNNELERKLRLERGDEVEIVHFNSTELENGLLAGCKVTYLDRVAVSNENIVFLLLQNCAHPYFANKQTWYEVRPFHTIRKKYETQ